MTRKDIKTFENELSVASYRIETDLQIWGSNFTLEEKKVTLDVSIFDLHSEWKDNFQKDVTLLPNQSTELFQGSVPGQPVRTNDSDVKKTLIVSARLLDEGGAVLARYANWYGFR